jgi:hypothetical protein
VNRKLQQFWLYQATNKEIAVIVIASFLGGLIREILLDNTIVLPYYDKEMRALHLGILGSIIIGTTVGFLVDNSPLTAFAASVGAPVIIEGLVRKIERLIIGGDDNGNRIRKQRQD